MIPIDIIIIDDEKDYCEAIKTNARNHGLRITDFQNLEDGYKCLSSDPKYKGVILDARCLRTPEQETEGDDFLPFAIDQLKEIERETNRIIPFVVNTGYVAEQTIVMYEKFIIEKKSRIFNKGQNDVELFNFLIEAIERIDVTKIEQKYHNVFKSFEKNYLPTTIRTELVNILLNFEHPAKKTDTLRRIRVVQDEIYNSLENIRVLPSGMTFPDKNLFLSNKHPRRSRARPSQAHQNKNIEFLAPAIYKICSEFGSHPPRTNQDYPTIYSVISITHALLEQIIWYINLRNRLGR